MTLAQIVAGSNHPVNVNHHTDAAAPRLTASLFQQAVHIFPELHYRRSGSRRRCRQFKPKTTPLAQLRLDAHFPAHAECCSANDGQTEPRAFICAVHTMEYPENLMLMLRGYADAVVRKPQSDQAALLLSPNVHSGNDSRGHELYGIVEQV